MVLAVDVRVLVRQPAAVDDLEDEVDVLANELIG